MDFLLKFLPCRIKVSNIQHDRTNTNKIFISILFRRYRGNYDTLDLVITIDLIIPQYLLRVSYNNSILQSDARVSLRIFPVDISSLRLFRAQKYAISAVTRRSHEVTFAIFRG